MKSNRCCVYIENKKGDFYLVELKQNEEQMVINLISQFNNGVIKVFKEKQPLTRNKANN